jgi:hypothetical protein
MPNKFFVCSAGFSRPAENVTIANVQVSGCDVGSLPNQSNSDSSGECITGPAWTATAVRPPSSACCG